MDAPCARAVMSPPIGRRPNRTFFRRRPTRRGVGRRRTATRTTRDDRTPFEEVMHMARPEKVAAVEQIREDLQASQAVFVTDYRGLTVTQMTKLRRKL